MNNIRDITAPSRSGPVPRRSRRSPRPSAGPTAPAHERCFDDIAARSLSLWQEVLTAVRGQSEAPKWVPDPLWLDALAHATGQGHHPVDIESRLGRIEDLTFREAQADHYAGCPHHPDLGRSAVTSTWPGWGDSRYGFRLASTDQPAD